MPPGAQARRPARAFGRLSCGVRSSESLARANAHAVQEITHTHMTPPFGLNFLKTQQRFLTARDDQIVPVRFNNFSCPALLPVAHNACSPDDESLRVVSSVGIRPWLKAAHAPLNLRGVERPINKAILFSQNGGVCRL